MTAPPLTAAQLAYYKKHPSKAAADGLRICARPDCDGPRFFRPTSRQPERKYCCERCQKQNSRVEKRDEEGMEAARRASLAHTHAIAAGEWDKHRQGHCKCNGSHILERQPTDSGWGCAKCGGRIDGQAIYAFIREELKAGTGAEQVASKLNGLGAPMAVPGHRRKWSAGAVLRVAAAGTYLPSPQPAKQEQPVGVIWREATEDSSGETRRSSDRSVRREAGLSAVPRDTRPLPAEFHEVKVYRAGEPFKPKGKVEIVAAADLTTDEPFAFVPKKRGRR